jgi:N-acetyl-gamma-glutamyl-phosphate reductase
MTAKVFIDGEAGTTGLQIAHRLKGRRDIELLHLSDSERKDARRRAEMLNAADVSILCLPDDAAREAVAMLGAGARVIDASTAHRVAEGWTYGFPELDNGQPAAIANASYVANPGCYALGAISMLHPLVSKGLIPAGHPVTLNAVSGYSGGGKSLIAAFEDPNAARPTESAFYLYALGLAHKHVPEITEYGRLTHPPLFVPSVGRFAQGMIVSLPLQLWSLPGAPTADEVHAALSEHYAGKDGPKGICVAPLTNDDFVVEGAGIPSGISRPIVDPEALNGTDRLSIHVFANRERQQAVVCAVLDNLGKGAAGQAVQNLELMLGLAETSSPAPVGVYA